MTWGLFIDQGKARDSLERNPIKTTRGQLWGPSYEVDAFESNSNAKSSLLYDEYAKRNDEVFKITGERLDRPMQGEVNSPLMDTTSNPYGPMHGLGFASDPVKDLQEQRLQKLKQKYPQFADKLNAIPAPEKMEENARDRANMARTRWDALSENASWFDRNLTGVVGGLRAAATDPINVGASIFSGGLAPAANIVGAGLKGMFSKAMLKGAVREAGVNMAAEAAIQPSVAKWQKELGREYGLDDAATNIAFAGLFGGVMPYGSKVVGAAAGKAVKPLVKPFTKGAEYGSKVFSKLGDVVGLDRNARDVAKAMSKAAQVTENNPFPEQGIAGMAKHMDATQHVLEAYETKTTGVLDDLPVKAEDFDKLPIDNKIILYHGSGKITGELTSLKKLREGGDSKVRAANNGEPSMVFLGDPDTASSYAIARVVHGGDPNPTMTTVSVRGEIIDLTFTEGGDFNKIAARIEYIRSKFNELPESVKKTKGFQEFSRELKYYINGERSMNWGAHENLPDEVISILDKEGIAGFKISDQTAGGFSAKDSYAIIPQRVETIKSEPYNKFKPLTEQQKLAMSDLDAMKKDQKAGKKMLKEEAKATAGRAVTSDVLDLSPPKPMSLAEYEKMTEELSSPEFHKAQMAEFDRLSEVNERAVIIEDGKAITLADLKEEFKHEDSLLEAIKVCGVG